MKTERGALASLLGGCVIFGTIGLFIRQIPRAAPAIAAVRGISGALLLLPLLLGKRDSLRFSGREWARLVASGAALGLNWVLLFLAYQYVSVAVASLCNYLAPILVILVSPIFFREKLTIRAGICAAMALGGMLCISGVIGSGSAADPRGLALALAAALLYAALVILNKKMTSPDGPRTVIQLAVSGLVAAPYAAATGGFAAADMTVRGWVFLAVVCVVHTGLAYLLYFGGLRRLPAQTASLCSFVDPLTAVLTSALLLGEPLGWTGALGTVLILGATAALSIKQKTD